MSPLEWRILITDLGTNKIIMLFVWDIGYVQEYEYTYVYIDIICLVCVFYSIIFLNLRVWYYIMNTRFLLMIYIIFLV